ncbi:Mitochondrial import inner membrane translocase subunit tim16 [Hondaea fermentalgiana]|uniref:Mitochondrial import inner membrane translocase subunit tim16 n=1 Tax=Hondaea fermentalgiana TaxID=2315210 RepID=A0A2R5G4P3_9STRA|nr:Mitochondrial import inner membrane translocase subunit tim16 [Hondaea fermentalgiana]|eukprot:GBG25289.1 Mitochondrial import inner membrane translocase subunit tim16 [Hondaea fermentalgiana]
MSGPIVRLFVQVFVAGVGVVSRAFVQAYQQAAANPNAAKAAAANAKRSLRKEMKLDEALKVLNFDSTPKNLPEVTERYEQYFNANDPKKGGSFYLQSKFHRAKEVVEKQLAEEAAAKAGKPAEKSDESK